MPMSAFLNLYILIIQVSTVTSGFVTTPNVTETGFLGKTIRLNWQLSVTDVADFIKWSLDSTTIASSQRINDTDRLNAISSQFQDRTTISERGTLTIDSLALTDEGSINCEVTLNTGTVVSSKINLFVLVAPTFVTTPVASLEKTEGEGVTLNCAFDSKPQAKLVWLKDNVEVSSTDSLVINTEVTSKPGNVTKIDSSLQISNISRTDGALYKCVAIYKHKDEERSSDLTVYYSATITSFPPHLSETVEHATNFEITCNVQSNPQPNITWYKGNVPVTSSDSQFTITGVTLIKKETYKSIFTVKVVRKEDFGNYTCEAINIVPGRGKQVMKKTTTLVVTHKPYFLFKPPKILNVIKGVNVVLNCTVQAFPEPTVNWTTDAPVDSRFKFHPLKLLQQTQGKRVVEALLEIQSVKKEDYGMYRCKASDGNTIQITNTTLIIQYEPIILNRLPTQQTVAEFSIVQLQCSVESNPQAEIEWFYTKDMTAEVNITHQALVTTSSTASQKRLLSTLIFQGRGLSREEEGYYQCKVKNVLGSKNLTTNITVEWPSEFSMDSINNGRAIVRQGEKAYSLKCIVSSKPIAEIKWLKDDLHEIKPSVENVLFVNSTTKIKESFLTLTNIQPENRGSYSCVAVNQVAGSTVRRSRKKYVEVLYPPITKVTNSTTEVNITESFTLSCKAEAHPPVSQYLWRRDDVSLPFNQSALYFFSANERDGGTYSCTPSNSEGAGATVIHTVTVKVTPTITLFPTCTQIERMLFCICDGVGYPSPTVIWTKEGSSQHLSNKTTLNITIGEDTAGVYVCTLMNVNGEERQKVKADSFDPPVNPWGPWGACNTTCGVSGYRNRTRDCNFNFCTEDLVDLTACMYPCPTAASFSDTWHKDWYIFFWVLIPVVLVLLIILILWVARRKGNKKKAVFVPVNRSLSQPPSIRSISTKRDIFLPQTRSISAVNKGYLKEVEHGNDGEEKEQPYQTDTIEVEMHFGPENDAGEDMYNAPRPDYDEGEDIVNAPIEQNSANSYGDVGNTDHDPRSGGDGNSASESFTENEFTFSSPNDNGFLNLYDYASPMKPPRNNKSTFGAPINQLGHDNEAFYTMHQNGFV